MKQPLLMHINNSVFLRGAKLVMIDRRCLPQKLIEVEAVNYLETARAIEDMVVQGAGDIAITAAYGLYLAALEAENNPALDLETAKRSVFEAYHRLINTRPTGHHLAALLTKIIKDLEWENANWSGQILNGVNASIKKQQKRSSRTGQWASKVLEDGDRILTHCFPGAALLYMLSYAREQNKKIEVICNETRPYLQGARLTAWSVSEMGIPVTLISDNMAAYCMSQGLVTKVFTAADRIAMDGTIANKIGTFQLALAARYHQLPFYILGYGGPDKSCRKGTDIVIEQRDPNEVLYFNGTRITGDKVNGFYPAFDLTPTDLITGIITNRGIITPGQVDGYWTLPV